MMVLTLLLLGMTLRVSAGDLENRLLLTFGADLMSDMKSPSGIMTGADQCYYITDKSTDRVLKFSPEGRFVSATGGRGRDAGRFDAPSGLARRRGFGLFVCDTRNQRLVQLDENLAFISLFDLSGLSQSGLFEPAGIASSIEDVLYVADGRNGEILVLDRDNKAGPLWGPAQSASRPLLTPGSLAAGRHLFVDDRRSGRILCLDRYGNTLLEFGDSLDIADNGLALVSDTLLYAADRKSGRILAYSNRGLLLGGFAPSDSVGLFSPGALCASPGHLAVINPDRRIAALFAVTPSP